MARAARGYRCRECGWSTVAYVGRCGECQQWNTVEQAAEPASRGPATRIPGRPAAPGRTVGLADVLDEPGKRLVTGIPELDRVLGANADRAASVA
ncbi:MAG TPA: hypothetical protein PJ994_05935, partial [Tepidiformaceae bacterium]|nr:hypothetical protein [Tepidiformaceae bacterium]